MNKIIVMIFLIISSASQADDLLLKLPPLEYQLTIDRESFKKDLLCLVRSHHSKTNFEARMQAGREYIKSISPAITETRMSITDYLERLQENNGTNLATQISSKVSNYAEALSRTILGNKVFEMHFTHSAPLIDRERIDKSSTLKLEQLMGVLSRSLRPYDVEEIVQDGQVVRPAYTGYAATINLVNDPKTYRTYHFDATGKIEKSHRSDESELMSYEKTIFATSAFSDHFVNYLLNKNRETVKPMELILALMPFYNNDVLSTLGVIGYSFERERKACIYYRKALCYFNSRMSPLIISPLSNTHPDEKSFGVDYFDDTIGYNYHFWGFLNAGLQGNKNLDVGSYMYEVTSWRKDYGDFIADTVGFQIGSFVYDNINNAEIICP